jgi:electron transfer flavoprotein alpha subunit
MSEVLVVVEHAGGAVKKVTLEMLTLARGLGSPSAVVFGPSGTAAGLTDKLAEFGADKVYVAESGDVDGFLVAPKATILAKLIGEVSPAAVLLGSTQEGKEIAARVAVKLDNGLLTDVLSLEADGTATQAIFAGSTVVTSKVTRGLPLVTVRPNSLTPVPSSGAAAVSEIDATVDDASKLVTVTSRQA